MTKDTLYATYLANHDACQKAMREAKEFVHVWNDGAGIFADTLCTSWDEALDSGMWVVQHGGYAYSHTLTDLGRIDMSHIIKEEIERIETEQREKLEHDRGARP